MVWKVLGESKYFQIDKSIIINMKLQIYEVAKGGKNK